ncbi:hypothetical protein NI389_04210 [Pseudoalteromonas xiamenensis]|uniref:hypothetical protein n=1 Tax=Pseudoalteromonas xiamenensis TaxID=882626 RepID=UPI0027E4B175|nr:hypothetical protein [Pseudoalteromonas xiamenensis]WMN60617.1 hypothetical protein NI389_04210 [Pseudoalteromonas xiamenensis]
MTVIYRPVVNEPLEFQRFIDETTRVIQCGLPTAKQDQRLAHLLFRLSQDKFFLIEKVVREIQAFGELPDIGEIGHASVFSLFANDDAGFKLQARFLGSRSSVNGLSSHHSITGQTVKHRTLQVHYVGQPSLFTCYSCSTALPLLEGTFTRVVKQAECIANELQVYVFEPVLDIINYPSIPDFAVVLELVLTKEGFDLYEFDVTTGEVLTLSSSDENKNVKLVREIKAAILT